MTILVLSPSVYDTSPGMRFRMEQWARYLEPRGYRFVFVPFESAALHRVLYRPGRYWEKAGRMLAALARRIALVSKVGRFDAVVLYREAALLGPALIERLLGVCGVPLLYDFDDPVWMPYRSPVNGIFGALKCQRKTASICRLATRVTVGNRLLAAYASEQGARHVDIVPSTIDMHQYQPRPAPCGSPAEPGLVTLGWTGSHSTLPFLRLIEDALRSLSQRRRFRLVVIAHDASYALPGIGAPVVARPWRAATEAHDLSDIDIGLAPFPDSGWTPWRCHGKVLQYMAAGIPPVASAIGILPDYIEDGRNGLLARGAEEWAGLLERLIDNAPLRHAMGAAAAATIRERYSAQVWAPRVGQILDALVASGKSR